MNLSALLRPALHPLALTLALAAVAATSLAGCEADLEEGCTSGTCGGASVASSGDATTGAGGGAPGCEFASTNGLPCDVFRVLATHCHHCHQDPPLNGAPFPLLTYDDLHADYFGKPVWQRMEVAIETTMPRDNPPLEGEPAEVLEAFFATCKAGECARGEGAGGGAATTGAAGGEGGAGQGGAGGSAGTTGAAGGAGPGGAGGG